MWIPPDEESLVRDDRGRHRSLQPTDSRGVLDGMMVGSSRGVLDGVMVRRAGTNNGDAAGMSSMTGIRNG